MTEKRIVRFDFSSDEPKFLGALEKEKSKATGVKRITPEKREAIKEGKKRQKEHNEEVLSPREKKFCKEYVKTCNGAQSVMASGYNVANNVTASVQANSLLKRPKIQKEIQRIMDIEEKQGIADAKEVMQFFTDIMRGKVKDQFGLEASLAERAKAAQEVAKRTIDLDNKLKSLQQGDNTVTIKLDWQPTLPQT